MEDFQSLSLIMSGKKAILNPQPGQLLLFFRSCGFMLFFLALSCNMLAVEDSNDRRAVYIDEGLRDPPKY